MMAGGGGRGLGGVCEPAGSAWVTRRTVSQAGKVGPSPRARAVFISLLEILSSCSLPKGQAKCVFIPSKSMSVSVCMSCLC